MTESFTILFLIAGLNILGNAHIRFLEQQWKPVARLYSQRDDTDPKQSLDQLMLPVMRG